MSTRSETDLDPTDLDAADLDAADDLSFREDFDPVSTQQWIEAIESDLRGGSIDRLAWQSIEGISLRPFYRSEDLGAFDHLASNPLPLVSRGETEGRVSANAATDDERPAPGNPWQIRQEIVDASPEQAAHRIQSAIDRGAESIGLQVATGARDPHGCSLSTPDALADILRDADMQGTPLHLDGSAWAVGFLPAMLRFYENADSSAGVGSIAVDPVSALLRGDASTAAPLFDLASDAIHAVQQTHLSLRTLNVDLRPFHTAGASAVQELAYAAGCLVEQLSVLTEKGHRLADLVRALFVSVPVGTSYFIEIGKLRALRLLLARVLRAFGEEAGIAEVADVHPADLILHAHTSRRSETMYGPHVNLLRGSTEAAAAILGGADVVSAAPFDITRSGPSDLSTRLARNTFLMLRHESHLDQVADPGAGSYYIEAVTDALGHAAWNLFQNMEAQGGLLKSLSDGWLHHAIAAVREQRLEQLDTRQHVLVGTTHYPDVEDEGIDTTGVDTMGTDIEPEDAHSPTPASPDASSEEDPDGPFNAVSSLEDALRSGRSLPEIARSFQSGTFAVEPLPQIRLAEPFERLRQTTESYHRQHDHRPTVLLAPIGAAGPRSARATFARNMLGVAGFRIVEPLSFDDAREAARHVAGSEVDVIVLCSSDDRYDDLLTQLHEATTEQDLQVIIGVAGTPDAIATDPDTRPDFFVHRHAPLLETLRNIQSSLGIDADAAVSEPTGSE